MRESLLAPFSDGNPFPSLKSLVQEGRCEPFPGALKSIDEGFSAHVLVELTGNGELAARLDDINLGFLAAGADDPFSLPFGLEPNGGLVEGSARLLSSTFVIGDVNNDGAADNLDITPFIIALTWYLLNRTP